MFHSICLPEINFIEINTLFAWPSAIKETTASFTIEAIVGLGCMRVVSDHWHMLLVDAIAGDVRARIRLRNVLDLLTLILKRVLHLALHSA